jgi:hypothetical protein
MTKGDHAMTEDQVKANLKAMDDLDFVGWNNADWHGVFAHHHADDVFVDFKGYEPTRGLQDHIDAMRAFVESAGGTPPKVVSHPIAFGDGEWTCVVGEFEDGSRMVTVAKWRDGAIAEEYLWV